ncbi:class I SAM-dependent methyltransferase [Humidisolicoccus flavus]|uniref:class I SAM-dependent methyltransferase n=1 Tax=Humidisolicoccus flavus TaxID=3111414 RepID=UPI003254269A
MTGAHYFTNSPAEEQSLRTVRVPILGTDHDLVTAPGVFSADGLDTGTAVLLRVAELPPKTGNLLDLGCGWGPIALTLATASPEATVWAVDVNERALDLVRKNAQHLRLQNIRAVTPEEVPDDVRFAAIWSNPPIRVGKPVLHEMLRTWLSRLVPGGESHLVVQKHLGADSLLQWMQREFDDLESFRSDSQKTFRILTSHRESD